MRTSPRLLSVFIAVLLQAACTASSQSPSQKVSRQPFERSKIVLESPSHYEKEVMSYDPKTGEPSQTFDHKPRIEMVDEKGGRYHFKWIGHDGKEKVIEYQRPDAIDAIVSASVTNTPEGKYLYTYKIENLPSSGIYLSYFIVQNFAADAKHTASREGYVGSMSSDIQEFREGNWIGFGSSYFKHDVLPGRDIEVQIASHAPPGLVECRVVGGERTVKGAGEEIPQELGAMVPGFDIFPGGYTVGPISKLQAFSISQRAKYLLSILSQLKEFGWITDAAQHRYEQTLRSNDSPAVLEQADKDLQTEQITSEVHSMVRFLLGTPHQQATNSSNERKQK